MTGHGQLALLAVILFMVAGCEKQSISHGNWEYHDSGILSYQSTPLPDDLAANSIILVTPAGTFHPRPDRTWSRVSSTVPLPDATQRWVQSTIDSTPFTEAMKQDGFYRTDELPIDSDGWQDCQLGGTPPSWVYACKVTDGTERGYWIDPIRFDAIDWSEL